MILFRAAVLAALCLTTVAPAYSNDYIAECTAYIASGDYARAEDSGRKAVDASGRNVEAHVCLAEALQLRGDLHRARQQMKTADFYAQDNEFLLLRLALNEITPEQYQKQQQEMRLKIAGKLGDISFKLEDYNQARTEYQRSIALAKGLSDRDGERTALARLGDVYSATGANEQALASYRESLALASQDSEKSSLYNSIAVVYGKMKNYTAGEENLAKSLALDEKLGDKRAQAWHLINLGKNRQAADDYAGAADSYVKSRQVSQAVKDAYLEGTAERSLGDMYRALGNGYLARASYTAAHGRFVDAKAAKDAASMTESINSLAKTAAPPKEAAFLVACNKSLEAGNYDKAEENGRNAVDAAVRNVDAHFCLAEAWRLKGDLRRAQQQMKRADLFAKDMDYLSALKVATKEISQDQYQREHRELLLKISNRLGGIAMAMRDYEQAFDEFQHSIRLAKELGNKDEEATALSSLAGAHSALGEYEQSLERYREALGLTSRDPEISSLYNNMAVVYGQMGNFPVAEEYFAKSLALDEKLGDRRAQVMHLLNFGMNLQAKKDYAGAASKFGKSRQISRDLKNAYWEGAANRHFGDMYRSLGNMHLARASYIAARERFVAAHAVSDVDSMTGVIDDLAEPQPVAGIEIGSTGVSALLVALRTDRKGGVDFREILHQQAAPLTIHAKEGEALSPEELDSIAAGVKAASKLLLEERGLDRSVLTVMVTGAPAVASNRDALAKRITREIRLLPVFMTGAEKARYDFSGSVNPGKERGGLLLKVSAESTSLSALNANGTVVSADVPQGAFSAAHLREKDPRFPVEKAIRGEQAASFRKALKSKPEFSSRKTVYLEGDAARVVAVFTRPDKDGNLVRITTADLDKFITAVKKKHSPYFNPPLKKIKDAGVQLWAEGEIAWVKQTLVPDDLMAGAQYLKMLLSELNVKEAYVSRGGNWVAGRLYETARLADKLEPKKK